MSNLNSVQTAVTTSPEKSGEASENKAQNTRNFRWLPGRIAAVAVAAGFLGLSAAGIAALHARSANEALPAPHPPVAVQTLKLEYQSSYRETVRYVGQLEPARQTALAFERPGLVTAVHNDEGDRVKKGDVVATLDVAQLKARRRQHEAQIRELEARRDLARLTLNRQSRLQKNGWSPEQRLDEAEASVDALNAAIDRVHAQIASIDIDLEKSNLKAPFDGVIATRTIDEGAVIAAGIEILTVLEEANRLARIGLPPDVAGKLDPARNYAIETSAGIVQARLYASRPDLQMGTRTVTALFELANDNGAPFGEIVTLGVERQIEERGAWVPLVALKESARGLWSLMTVTEQDGVVSREAAEILYVDAEHAYVRGTFAPGARVIWNGTNRIVPGQRVAVAGS